MSYLNPTCNLAPKRLNLTLTKPNFEKKLELTIFKIGEDIGGETVFTRNPYYLFKVTFALNRLTLIKTLAKN